MSPQSPWSSKGSRFSLGLNIIGGLIVGYAIGFIPILMQFNQYLGDCGRYTSKDTCSALTDAKCVWVPVIDRDEGLCKFPDHATVTCSMFTSQDSCKSGAGDACYWQYHKEVCSHSVGWSANEQGMIAGAQILGAMASSPSAGPLANKFGRRWSVAICAAACLLSCFCFSLGWGLHENYGLLIVAEVLIGLSSGWLSVICPMYCGEMAAKLEETIGVLFQVHLTLGILAAAVMGLVLDPRTDTGIDHVHLQRRFQYVIAVQWVIAACVLPAAFFMPESTLWLAERRADKKDEVGSGQQKDGASSSGNAIDRKDQTEEDKERSLLVKTPEPVGVAAPHKVPSNSLCRRDLLLPLGVGMALASAQQLTGINAVMIYGPQLVGRLGLKPLVGNFYIMLWNFLTCLLSIPLVRKFSARKLYIGSTAVATIACLVTGIFVFPGVSSGTFQQVVAGAGLLLFVAAFECGIGPCFYVLAQDIFPEDVRSAGCSYTIWIQFVFNVVINWGFPVAMTGFSGGPSGDQNQGMAICFLTFAFFGLITTLFLFIKMPKTNMELKREANNEALFGEKASTNRAPDHVDIY